MHNTLIAVYVLSGLSLFAMLLTQNARGLPDAILMCVLGLLLDKKQSRTAAILLLAYAVFTFIVWLSEGGWIVPPLVLLGFGFYGMRGAFAWHWLSAQSSGQSEAGQIDAKKGSGNAEKTAGQNLP